jgi:hypothetical protein
MYKEPSPTSVYQVLYAKWAFGEYGTTVSGHAKSMPDLVGYTLRVESNSLAVVDRNNNPVSDDQEAANYDELAEIQAALLKIK